MGSELLTVVQSREELRPRSIHRICMVLRMAWSLAVSGTGPQHLRVVAMQAYAVPSRALDP